ncbi:DUF935 domain-containing protein [Marivibrio halodurans]|uniref:DUF935 domain-containing protein n=1 Tax=Marivibrio halodurans TaxID=2039722 RepID=A0A8J7SMA5_9PROT|nr:DUF935 domain-containing protein [Marivibrio halodurans]MBP5857283.1 DUF935 domain-containing protein [Marivibrio halodurans]
MADRDTGLVDQWGRPIRRADLTQQIVTATVGGVRQTISEHPSVGLTPGRLARLLRDAEEDNPSGYLALAEEMEEKDLHYLSVLGTRKRQVSQLPIRIEAASDEKEDVINAEMAQEFVGRDVLQGEIKDILDAVGKGFSVNELIWDMSERDWRPVAMEWVDPRWIVFDTPDRRTPRLLGEHGQGEDLQPFKFVYHMSKCKSGLPIRGGLARAAAWTYLFKNFDMKGWVEFAEIYGQPLRVGKFGSNASEEDKRTLLRAVANIGRDAAAIIPDSMLLEFIEAKGGTKGAEVYERLAAFLDQQVSKAVLGQTATTDAIAGGHAVGKEHNDVRGDIERADANELEATIGRQIIRPLIDLNRGPQKRYPSIKIGNDEDVDVDVLSKALQRLVPMGLKVGQNQVRGMMGFKEPTAGDDLLTAPASATGYPGATAGDDPDDEVAPPRGRPARNVIARNAVEATAADLAERLTGLVDQAAGEPMDRMIEQLRREVEEADSLDSLAVSLLALYPEMDPSGVGAALERGLTAAYLAGAAEVPSEAGAGGEA